MHSGSSCAGEDGFTQIKGGRGRSAGKVRSCRRHETSVSRETSRFLTLPRLVVQGVIHGVDAAGASRRSYDEQGAPATTMATLSLRADVPSFILDNVGPAPVSHAATQGAFPYAIRATLRIDSARTCRDQSLVDWCAGHYHATIHRCRCI